MLREDVEQIIKPTVEEMGYVLWGCEYLAQGKHSLLRVYIDKKDGIGITDCEKVSHRINAILDVEDPIPGNYHLEVSSPGIPRPLFSPGQYLEYIGKEVQIRLMKPVDGKRKFVGKISTVNELNLVLDVGGVHQDFLFSNVVKANLMVE